MTVLAARPGMGKTAMLLNVAEHLTADARLGCALFSLETSHAQLAQRLMCSRGRVDSYRLRKGMLGPEEYARLANVVGELARAPLWLTCVPRLRADQWAAAAHHAVRRQGAKLLLADGVQLMGDVGDGDDRLARVSRQLRETAAELSVPLLCTSPLRRAGPRPASRRPRLDYLAGELVDDADVVLLLHREDFYQLSEPDFEPDHSAEVIIAKHRGGPTGVVRLRFDGRACRFENLT